MKSSTVLDPMPDVELTGHRLDLGRPELRELMNRYTGSVPQARTTELALPSVLVVSNRPGGDEQVREALRDRGWSVKSCAGPGTGDCPLMRGNGCPLRRSVDAAVVFVDPNRCGGGLGAIPRLRCAGDSASPGVIAVEESAEPARFAGVGACVGAARGAQAILSALSTLLERDGV